MFREKCIVRKNVWKMICACLCAAVSVFVLGGCDKLAALLPNLQEEQEQVGVIYALSEDKKSARVVGYNGEETTVVVQDSYQGVPVTRIDNDAFALRPIVSVTLPDTVQSIGFSAFYYCVRLQTVRLSNNLQAIGGSAFENCDLLMQINVPDSVQTIGRRAFAECSGLTIVTFGSNVKYIGARVIENSRNVASVTFAQTSGWMSGNKAVSAEDLSNPATAARHLRVTYYRDGWTRA